MRNRAVVICALVLMGLLLVPSLSFFTGAVGQTEASEPPWQVGDTWAIGTEVDLFEDYQNELNQLEQDIRDESEGEVRNLDLNLRGVVGFYNTGEVVAPSNPDLYAITTESAVYFHSLVSASLEARLPKAGTYDSNDDPPTYWTEMSYQESSNLVLRVTSTQTYTQDTWELKQVDAEAVLGWREAVKGQNLPYIDYKDYDDETITIDYNDVDLTAKASLTFGLTLQFDPALNVYDFPLLPNEEWSDTTTVTLTGYLYGDLDISEPDMIPQAEMADMFAGLNEGFAEAGLTKRVYDWNDLFPLHIPSAWMIPTGFDPWDTDEEQFFENVTLAEDRFLFGPVTGEPVTFDFRTGDQIYVPLPEGGQEPAVEYEMVDLDELEARGNEGYDEEYLYNDDPTTAEYVSTQDGRTVKLTLEVPDYESGDYRTYQAQPVTVSTATAQMSAKANPADPTQGGYALDSDSKLFTYLLLVGAAMAIVGSSGYIVHRHRNQKLLSTPATSTSTAPTPQQVAYGQAGSGAQASVQPIQYQSATYPPTNTGAYAAGYGVQPPTYQQPAADPYAPYREPAPAPQPQAQPPSQQPLLLACSNCSGHFQVLDTTAIVACPHCGLQGRLGG